MAELLDTVEVSRVSINKKKDLLRIYVVSHQWIHKKYIYQLERQIEEQLFSNVPLRVKIIERFYLCLLYTSCLVLCIIVMAFNLLGDGLRDALDPRLRQ